MPAAIPPEFQLLLDCAARVCGRSREFPNASFLHVPRLLELARRHRVVPLLRKFALDIPGSEIFIQPVDDAHAYSLRRSLVLASAMLDLHSRFAANGMTAVPLKGAAVAAQLYEGEVLRSSDDIDFLIAESDFLRAHDVVSAQGYQPMFNLARYQWRCFPKFFDEIAYRHPETGVEVDLQWRACSRAYSFAPDTALWFQRLGKITLSGRELPALHEDDLLEFLLIHGSKHGWARLGWLMDIAMLLSRRPPNWIQEWLKPGPARRMRSAAICLSAQLLGTPSGSGEECPQDLLDRIIAGMHSSDRELANYDLFPELMQAPSDRRRYRYETTIRPTGWEWELLPLPYVLCPLYFLLRPLRIAARTLTRRQNRLSKYDGRRV